MSFISDLFSPSSGGAGQALTQAGASAVQANYLNQLQQNVAPFVQTGQGMNRQLANELTSGQLGQPFNMTQAQLMAMPGYQFALNQGLAGVQNAAAMRGLGVSGAALKGAANFATGLANQNFQQAFQDYWANQQNRYNMLYNLAGQGANAAVGIASPTVSGAANLGAGISGIGNALTQGMQQLTNVSQMNSLINALNPNTNPLSGAAALNTIGSFSSAAAPTAATTLSAAAPDVTNFAAFVPDMITSAASMA